MSSKHPSKSSAGALGPDMLARVKRLCAPACLVLVALHVVLTCSSWRYTAPLLMLDISPSMFLASIALLFHGPSSWFLAQPAPTGELALQEEQQGAGADALSSKPSSRNVHFASDSDSTAQTPFATATAALSRPQEGGLLRKLWRKLAQASKPVANATRQARRHSPIFAESRPSLDSHSSTPRASWRQRTRSGSRWAPTMSRITSGQHLATMDDSSSVATSVTSRRQGEAKPAKEPGADLVPLVPHMGHLAVDCVQHDTTLPHSTEVNQVLTPQHLLQFGALLGESSAELALSQAGLPPAMGRSPSCLLGATDDEAHWGQGWEPVAHEVCPQRGLHYCAWRRYLRKGLYAYKSRTVFDGVSPQQLAAFYLDSKYKVQWDDACTQLVAIPPPRVALIAAVPSPVRGRQASAVTCDAGPPGASGFAVASAPTDSDSDSAPTLRRSSTGNGSAQWVTGLAGASSCEWHEEAVFARSCYMYARTRFPAPMAQREYIYARRVWAKADDGGCYLLSKATDHPAPPAPGGRAVRVQDFVAGTVIRSSALGNGRGPAAEMVTVYFEDSHVSAGIMNLGVRKALWPMVQKMEVALRKHLVSPEGAALQVATSAAFQQACFAPSPGQANPGLRRCVSAAGSCRTSMDGEAAGEAVVGAPALQATRSARLPSTGVQPTAGGALSRRISERYRSLAGAVSRGASAAVATPAQAVVVGVRRFASLLAALLGMLVAAFQCSSVVAWVLHTYSKLRGRTQAALLAERHARVLSHPVHDIGKPASRIKWGKRLASRLAMVAVRAVGLPLAHRVLNRCTQGSSGGAPYGWPSSARSDSMSVSSSHGGTSRMALHGGRPGASGTQASMSESTARVRHWLDPAASQAGYLLAPSTELMEHHTAMQQLQQLQVRRQSQQPAPSSGQPGSRGLSLRPSLGLAVVDGVPLALDRAPVVPPLRPAPGGPSNTGGGRGQSALRGRRF